MLLNPQWNQLGYTGGFATGVFSMGPPVWLSFFSKGQKQALFAP